MKNGSRQYVVQSGFLISKWTTWIWHNGEQDLSDVILYGSCARGDFHEDSDVDIALLTKCDRIAAERYGNVLAQIVAKLALKYFAVVNFACIPKEEYDDKKAWYPYFQSIEHEGVSLYGR